MEELNSPETGPRYKILVLGLSPGAKPELKMAELLFGRLPGAQPKIEDYLRHLEASRLEALGSTEMPDLLAREIAADKTFEPGKFFPEKPAVYQGLVITGSPFMAYPRATSEGQPYLTTWKKEIINFIKEAVEQKTPILGICYGAQILAEALGGETEKMKTAEGKDVWEWGWNRISRAPGSADDLIMKGLPAEFVAAENRKDCVSKLPEGAILLAENEYGIQGFRVDDEGGQPLAWGFQFHPERKPAEVNDLLFERPGDEKQQKKVSDQREKLKAAGLDPQKIAGLAEVYAQQDPLPSVIFANYLDFVRGKI